MYICKYCGKLFETPLKLGGHTSKCKLNPKYDINVNTIAKSRTLTRFLYKCNCEVCNTQYNVICTEKDFLKLKYKKTCSDRCSKLLTVQNTDIKLKNNKILKSKEKLQNTFDKHIYRINSVRQSEKYKQYKFPILQKNQCEYCGSYNCNSNICKLWSFLKILTLIKYFGFDSTTLGTKLFTSELIRIKTEIETIYKSFGSYGLFEKYGYPEKHVGNILNYLGIKRFNLSEAISLNWKLGKIGNNENNTLFKTEHHITWNNKIVYLRSSYESDYANELDTKKILYEVESLRIEYFDSLKNKKRIAVPDFYLPETNTIVEIKSSWTLNLQEMKDKFIEYNKLGYITKLIYEHQETDINTL